MTKDEFYSVLAEENSIGLINLFYRVYYNNYCNWGKKFSLSPFPIEYKKYEERIRNEYNLYIEYGKMLYYYSNIPNLPLYLQEELNQYDITTRSIRLKHERLPGDIPLFKWSLNLDEYLNKGEMIVWI